jgi:flagellar FliL protein
MKKLIPIIIILVFAGAGVAAGLMLKPDEEMAIAEMGPCGDDPNTHDKGDDKIALISEKPNPASNVTYDYVKLNNQFIVPMIKGDVVRSVAIVALSIEVKAGTSDKVYSVEPRLRDSFLQALFDHASLGGFDGDFATTENLLRMRRSLKQSAVAVLGDLVNDVLVTDIARQDN